MAIITTGQTFTATGPVTNIKLQDIASAATFDDPVDGESLVLIDQGGNQGKLGVKDAGITPAKLSAGAPSWDASGALLSSNVTAPESANSLLLRSDPETPGTGADGGSQIRLFSSDSSFPDQINHKGDYHIFNNIAGDLQGSIPYFETPTLPQHFTRKDYVDEYALTYNGSTGTLATTTSWADWDLSSFVGSNRALVIIELYDASGINQLLLKTKGSQVSGGYVSANVSGWGSSGICLANADQGGTVQVITDENGFVEVQAFTAGTGINFTIQAFQKLLIPTP